MRQACHLNGAVRKSHTRAPVLFTRPFVCNTACLVRAYGLACVCHSCVCACACAWPRSRPDLLSRLLAHMPHDRRGEVRGTHTRIHTEIACAHTHTHRLTTAGAGIRSTSVKRVVCACASNPAQVPAGQLPFFDIPVFSW
jgi:hypothetical protein